jgi:hypothetical protein
MIDSASMCSMPTLGRHALSHRPHRSMRALFIATDSLLTPRAAYSSMFESNTGPISSSSSPPNAKRRGSLGSPAYTL